MPRKNDREAQDGPAATADGSGVEPAGEAAPNPLHPALAGALPDWDLVPHSPFIRRH